MTRMALDTETTGLNVPGAGRPPHDEVLSLAVVGDGGEILWDRLYRPEHVASWPAAQAVNGISPDDVADRPSLRDDAAELSGLLARADEVVVYNAEFDLAFLAAAGISLPDGATVLDPMLGFAEAYGQRDFERGGWKWHRLAAAAEAVGHEWTGAAHGALADARAALAVQDALDAGWKRGD